jgi:inosine/guanosine/xanthosine phosphorylase family protein
MTRPLAACVRRVARASDLRPALAVVLGSGLLGAADRLRVVATLDYTELPGFPKPGVRGHPGKLLVGLLAGQPVFILQGRAHYYEGLGMDEVVFPIRALAACGVRAVLLTNAAGAINPRFRAGDFMAVSDHINFMGINPLRGASESGFVDLTEAYDPALRRVVEGAGRDSGMKMRRGVYLAVTGPAYETPAEIRAFARLGADAVGMSLVPETVAARQCGLRVAGLSCLTNLAAGLGAGEVSHEETLRAAGGQAAKLGAFLESFAAAASPLI